MKRYRVNKKLSEADESFSETNLVMHFKGESKEMRRYVIDWVRNSVTSHKDNKLRDYIEYGGRKSDVPFSYSTVEKTFYSLFVYPDMLTTNFNYGSEEGKNPRELEIEQLVRLMSMVAEIIYIGRFDRSLGTSRIERQLQQGAEIPPDHVRAFRMAKEEVLHNWLRYIKQVVQNFFITTGQPIDEARIFHSPLPDRCWNNVGRFLSSLAELPLWVNPQLSQTAFGAKQSREYWHSIFQQGTTPDGVQVMADGLNLLEMIKD